MKKVFQWIDLVWTFLLQFVCYILGWSILPTITVMQNGVTFKMPFLGKVFQLYDKNPTLYIISILVLGYFVTLILYLMLKRAICNKYSDVYNSKKIQQKYNEFQFGAKKIDIVGGDLSFFKESSEQLAKVKELGNKCRILCVESQNNETRDLYKELVDAGVLVKTYSTNDVFSNIRGQFRDDESGEKCLLVNRIIKKQKTKYAVITLENKYMIQVMRNSFDEAFKNGKNPLIKLICFDMGGVYFDGDLKRDFLQEINKKLSQNIRSKHDQKLILSEKLNLGQMKITDWVEEKIGRTLNLDERNMVNELWQRIWKPNPDMKELVVALGKNNYDVGVWSNMDEQNGDIYKERGDFDVFSEKYQFLSYEIRYTKPHKEFFEYMLKSSGLEAYEILLIDDHEKNVLQAEKLGFQAIKYCGDIEKLKDDLSQKGIRI